MSQFEAVSDDDGGAERRTSDGAALPGAGRAVQSWQGAAPGAELAAKLAAMAAGSDGDGLAELNDFDLVEFTAAAQRMASWAHFLAASSAGELARRESMQPSVAEAMSTSLTPERVAGDEIALRLGWTSQAGQKLVREGCEYDGALAATGEALREGRIDPGKARAIAGALEEVPPMLAVGAQDLVLPRAPRRTATQLGNDVRSAIVELDPAEAAARSERARAKRCVSTPRALPDGMAGLWYRARAVDVQATYEAIDSAARAARRAGDSRTLDQLRADLLAQRVLHDSRCTDPNTNLPRGPGSVCRTAVRVDLRVLVPLSTLIGTDDEPGYLDEYGVIDPETARALAKGGTWRRLVTDPASGTVLDVGRTRYTPPADLAEHVRHRDRTCVRPGCNASAWKSELDHTIAFHTNSAPGGSTSAGNLGPLSKGCHQLKTHANFKLKQLTPGRFRWTTPTGHVYDHQAGPPLRSAGNTDHIHVMRQQLLEQYAPDPPTEPPECDHDPGPPPF